MCGFMFVGLSSAVVPTALKVLPAPLRFLPSENKDLLAMLPPDYRGFWLVKGECSCGLWPSANGGSELNPFQSRKWSKAKIARAFADQRNAMLARPRVTETHGVTAWLKDVPARTSEAVYVHFTQYSGDPNRQRVKVPANVAYANDLEGTLQDGAFNKVMPPVA